MIFKNSVRLLFSNFQLVWKTLAYLFISTLISWGITYLLFLPIYNTLVQANVFSQLGASFSVFIANFNLPAFLQDLQSIVQTGIFAIGNNIAHLWPYICGVVFAIVFINSFLIGFYKMANSNVLFNSMSSHTESGFFSGLFSVFRKNVTYNLVYLITVLPCKILIYVILFFMISLFKLGGAFIILTPILMLVTLIVLQSLVITLFSGWLPYVTITNSGVWSGLKSGVKTIRHKFADIFSNAVVTQAIIVFLIIFGGIFTLGALLVVLIPLALLFMDIFRMTAFFESRGMRYYLDANEIAVPSTREKKQRIKTIKYVV